MDVYKTTFSGYQRLLDDPFSEPVSGVPNEFGERTRKIRVRVREMVVADANDVKFKCMPHAGVANDVDVVRIEGGHVLGTANSHLRTSSDYQNSDFGDTLRGRLVSARLRVTPTDATSNGTLYACSDPAREDISGLTNEEIERRFSKGNMAVGRASEETMVIQYRPTLDEEVEGWVTDATKGPYEFSREITATEYPCSHMITWSGNNAAGDVEVPSGVTNTAYAQGSNYTLYQAGTSVVKYNAGQQWNLFYDGNASETSSAVEYVPATGSHILGSHVSTSNPLSDDEDYMSFTWNNSGVTKGDIGCGGNQWYELDHLDFTNGTISGRLDLNIQQMHPNSNARRPFLSPDDDEIEIVWDNTSSYSCPQRYRCYVIAIKRSGNTWNGQGIFTDWMYPLTTNSVKTMTWMDPIKDWYTAFGVNTSGVEVAAGSLFIVQASFHFDQFTSHNDVSKYSYISHKNRPISSNMYVNNAKWNYLRSSFTEQGASTTVTTQGQAVTGVNQGSEITYAAEAQTEARPQRFWVEYDAVYELSGDEVVTDATPNPMRGGEPIVAYYDACSAVRKVGAGKRDFDELARGDKMS